MDYCPICGEELIITIINYNEYNEQCECCGYNHTYMRVTE
jgi:hypothetical protein